MTDNLDRPSYHDLFITTEAIERTSIFNLPYGLFVTCNRTTGWELWDGVGNDATLVAGEYDDKWLVLDVAGHTIVDGRKAEAA